MNIFKKHFWNRKNPKLLICLAVHFMTDTSVQALPVNQVSLVLALCGIKRTQLESFLGVSGVKDGEEKQDHI